MAGFWFFINERGGWMPMSGGGDLTPYWFAAGLYVLLGLLFGGLSAQQAVARGKSPVRWFLAGFFFSIVGYLALVCRRCLPGSRPDMRGSRVAHTREPLACPKCGALNHPSARQCLDCGASLAPALSPETERASSETT